MRSKLLLRVVAVFLGLLGPINAATLVNDFSGPVTGYYFTDNPSSDPDYFSSAATQSATATTQPGQVDLGFYTVNFSDAQAINIGQHGRVTAFMGSFGTYDPDLQRYVGGNLFSLDNVTGFLLSLRREHLNTAGIINLYILSDQDQEFYFPINLNLLPASIFMDIAIDLTQTTIPAGTGAVEIAIKGDAGNPAPSTYSFSLDSLRAVPEPSSSLLILSGLSALALLRRRFR
jgi:hypothetical protein